SRLSSAFISVASLFALRLGDAQPSRAERAEPHSTQQVVSYQVPARHPSTVVLVRGVSQCISVMHIPDAYHQCGILAVGRPNGLSSLLWCLSSLAWSLVRLSRVRPILWVRSHLNAATASV